MSQGSQALVYAMLVDGHYSGQAKRDARRQGRKNHPTFLSYFTA